MNTGKNDKRLNGKLKRPVSSPIPLPAITNAHDDQLDSVRRTRTPASEIAVVYNGTENSSMELMYIHRYLHEGNDSPIIQR